MLNFSRTNDGILSRWWWSVDRSLLFGFLTMIAFGILLAVAATPMVANRIGIEEFYFFKRHLLYIAPSLGIIFAISNMSHRYIKIFALLLFFAAVFMTFMTLFFGAEIKGARRWIALGGFSIQPSEFAKPALAVLVAWVFSAQQKNPEINGKFLACFLWTIFATALVLQPDFGMLVVTTAVFGIQLFLNGLPIILVLVAVIASASGFVLAYLFLPHVTARVNKFLDPAVGDHYQINRSLEAFANGGLFGVGPGEGIVKKHLPDAHADFVFSVLGEEFGFFVCAFVVILIGFIVVHGMLRALRNTDSFSLLASVGLLSQFGLQSFVNMASTLHLIPTKGMTLPFMSYGGSSMFAISVVVGLILAFSKQKPLDEDS
ncbi:MAG: putative lipid II flippase FtsW [Alphaproteobacteria bacterium]|nr:cell division protein FtsW [Alphaproteobacteria bacterium]MCR4555927.1 putative lipid II flippase FtsW [Alphaproteobacteria bacterium]